MRNYGTVRRTNNDSKYSKKLLCIYAWCKNNGYRPAPSSDDGKFLDSARIMIFYRMKKGRYVSEEILNTMDKITKFPSYDIYMLRAKNNTKTEEKEAQKAPKDINEERMQKVFPMLKLIRIIFNEKVYENVLIAYKNDLYTKFLSDYFEYVLSGSTSIGEFLSRKCSDSKKETVIKAFINSKINTDDIRLPNQQISEKIGQLYGIDTDEVYLTLRNLIDFRHSSSFQEMRHVLKHYINNDIDSMLNLMPYELRECFIFQAQHKITDISTNDLLRTAEWIKTAKWWVLSTPKLY